MLGLGGERVMGRYISLDSWEGASLGIGGGRGANQRCQGTGYKTSDQ